MNPYSNKKKALIMLLWIIVFAILSSFVYLDNKTINLNTVTSTTELTPTAESTSARMGCFEIKDGQVNCGGPKYILPDVDIKTFSMVSQLVGKDKNHVYIINKIQPNVDAKSFHLLENKYDLPLPTLYTDKNGMYYVNGHDNIFVYLPFDPAAASSSESISPYIKVGSDVYYSGYDSVTKLDNVDGNSFRILGACYSVERSYAAYVTDGKYVFVGTNRLDGIDPLSLVMVANISHGDSEMPYTFFVWKDSKHVYAHCGKEITEVDYDSFKYVNGVVQDKNNIYSFHTGGGYYVTSKTSSTSKKID